MDRDACPFFAGPFGAQGLVFGQRQGLTPFGLVFLFQERLFVILVLHEKVFALLSEGNIAYAVLGFNRRARFLLSCARRPGYCWSRDLCGKLVKAAQPGPGMTKAAFRGGLELKINLLILLKKEYKL